jgi:addiction module HigA family antidote
LPMYNPPHPGLLVKDRFIEDEDGNQLGSVALVADMLGCHRSTLNNLINGKRAISPAMALALEKANGGSAEHWLAMQAAYDLFSLRQAEAA